MTELKELVLDRVPPELRRILANDALIIVTVVLVKYLHCFKEVLSYVGLCVLRYLILAFKKSLVWF